MNKKEATTISSYSTKTCEAAQHIVNLLDALLRKHNILIPNEQRQSGGFENEPIIGSDFANIHDLIAQYLQQTGYDAETWIVSNCHNNEVKIPKLFTSYDDAYKFMKKTYQAQARVAKGDGLEIDERNLAKKEAHLAYGDGDEVFDWFISQHHGTTVGEYDPVLSSMNFLVKKFGGSAKFTVEGKTMTAQELIAEIECGSAIGNSFRQKINDNITMFYMSFSGEDNPTEEKE